MSRKSLCTSVTARIEIINPGRFPAGLTPENIKESHESFPYNLRIAQVLYLSTYLEGWGTGVRRMIDLCREHGVAEPEYFSDGHTVKVVFRKGILEKNVTKDVIKELTDRQRVILESVSENPFVTTVEMSQKANVTIRTILRDIDILHEKGILAREGGRKNGRWVILVKSENENK